MRLRGDCGSAARQHADHTGAGAVFLSPHSDAERQGHIGGRGLTGYSSIAVALALPSDGKLIACDVSDEYTQVARRYWKEAEVENKIELRLAPALETLDALIADGAMGSFDFAFIDADKQNYDGYYERSLALLRSGGVLAIDNVLWKGQVADPKVNDPETQAIRKLNAKIACDKRVIASMLPIGDGLTLALKRRSCLIAW